MILSWHPYEADVRLPSPSYREYVELVATVLATLAVFQYLGIFSETPGVFDLTFLIGVGVFLPLVTYLLTVILENVEWVSQWDRMVQSKE